MPPSVLGWALVLGVAAMAHWVVGRFPRLAPETAHGVGAWVAAAFGSTLAAQLSFTALGGGFAPRPARALVVPPSGVCAVLSVVWTLGWALRASHR